MKTSCVLLFITIALCAQAQDIDNNRVLKAITKFQTSADVFKQGCITESGVDSALVDKLINTAQITDDDKLKCYLSCMMLKTKFMNDEGGLNIDVIVKGLDIKNPVLIEKLTQGCKGPKSDQKCPNAFALAGCAFGTLAQYDL